jgi:hypothetical protein
MKNTVFWDVTFTEFHIKWSASQYTSKKTVRGPHYAKKWKRNEISPPCREQKTSDVHFVDSEF